MASAAAEQEHDDDDTKTDTAAGAGDVEDDPAQKSFLTPRKKPKRFAGGDLVVQCHIIEARNLKGRGMGDMSDPVVKVELQGEQKCTEIKKQSLNCVWDQVLVWEKRNVHPTELEQMKVSVSVFDANAVRRDELIGSYEFDVSHVYFEPDHEIYRTWVALSNVKERGVQGYLRLSIVVLGGNDEQKVHPDFEPEDEEGDMLCVLMPPEIKQEGKLLMVKVYDALDLPVMDQGSLVGSKCDPYAKVDFAGTSVKTKHLAGQDVVFLKQLSVPVMEPVMGTKVLFSMYDWDAIGSSDRIATTTLDYAEIKRAGATSTPRWLNLYGAPPGKQRGVASKMNRGYIQGSHYRGRVLVATEVRDEKDPKVAVSDIGGPAKPPTGRWAIQMDVYEGSDIPRLDLLSGINMNLLSLAGKAAGSLASGGVQEAHLQLTWGAHCFVSKKAEIDDGRCLWYDAMRESARGPGSASHGSRAGPTEETILVDFPADPSQCPDVIIYLVVGGLRVSFVRLTLSEILASGGFSAPPEWHGLQEDLSEDALAGGVPPGALLFSIRAGPADALPKDVPAAARPFATSTLRQLSLESQASATATSVGGASEDLSELALSLESMGTQGLLAAEDEIPQVGNLTLTIVEAHSLPAADENGLSDPYVKIRIDDRKANRLKEQTSVKKKTLNPKWNETFRFAEVPVDTTLELGVKDWDRFSPDSPLGNYEAKLRTFSGKLPGEDFSGDTWVFVSDKFPDAKLRIKVEFRFLSAALHVRRRSSVSKKINRIGASLGIARKHKDTVSATAFGEPPRLSCQIRVHAYQARRLAAADRGGVSDPYLEVRCAGKVVRTDYIEKTVNPTWYKALAMNVQLPRNLDFAPAFNVAVYDRDTVGKDDILGRVFLPVADVLVDAGGVGAGGTGKNVVPRWYTLNKADGEPTDSEALLGFERLDAESSERPLPNLTPPGRKVWLHMVVLGCRGLNSVLGVHKPYLVFHLADGSKYKTAASSVPSASNPNFRQNFAISIQLPFDPLFAPVVEITCKDAMLGGFVKRVLGRGVLQISDYMGDLRAEEIAAAKPPLSPGGFSSGGRKKTGRLAGRLKGALALGASKPKASETPTGATTPGHVALDIAAAPSQQAAAAAAASPGAGSPLEPAAAGSENLPMVQFSSEFPSQMEPMEVEDPAAAASANSSGSKSPSGRLARGRALTARLMSSKGGRPRSDTQPLLSDGDDTTQSDVAGLSGSRPGRDELSSGGKRPRAATAMSPGSSATSARGGFRGAAGAAEDSTDDKEVVDANDMDEGGNLPVDVPKYMIDRAKYGHALEEELVMKPFNELELYTGSKKAGRFEAPHRQVGVIKSFVKLSASETPDLPIDLAELTPQTYIVRLYVLRAYRLMPKDDDGTADPYLKISLGKTKISTRKRKINNELNPEFYEAFEIPAVIPGDSLLKISVWDWDGIGDDLIGDTVIDVEDRWFSEEWRAIQPKPVETRSLFSPSSSSAQGRLELWLEVVHPDSAKRFPMVDIKPPPPQPFELRCIVWQCKDVAIHDTITDMNDLYVTGLLDVPGVKKQQTDTHMRSEDGRGSFNWRMKFPVVLPMKRPPRFRIQLWDKDFFSPNDSICEANLSLSGLFRRAVRKNDRVQLRKGGKERFWIENLSHPNFEGNQGRVEISLEVMPKAVSEQLPAGFGRSPPNMNPQLPEPDGRKVFLTLNPIKLLRNLLGKKFCLKLALLVCVSFFLSFLYLIGPSIFANLVV